jgi:GNAT superfamily N-acetyltransferase
MSVRFLRPGDESRLDAFLSAHRDSSMFLRGNMRSAGLEYHGQYAQAIYAAAFRDEQVIGVVAHCIVQLGGIYTPPPLRGRGFAKAAVAASLIIARERGAARAVLFTDNPSAVRTYEALGFRRVGDYSLVFFQ